MVVSSNEMDPVASLGLSDIASRLYCFVFLFNFVVICSVVQSRTSIWRLAFTSARQEWLFGAFRVGI